MEWCGGDKVSVCMFIALLHVSDGIVSSSWSSYTKKREELADCLATVH